MSSDWGYRPPFVARLARPPPLPLYDEEDQFRDCSDDDEPESGQSSRISTPDQPDAVDEDHEDDVRAASGHRTGQQEAIELPMQPSIAVHSADGLGSPSGDGEVVCQQMSPRCQVPTMDGAGDAVYQDIKQFLSRELDSLPLNGPSTSSATTTARHLSPCEGAESVYSGGSGAQVSPRSTEFGCRSLPDDTASTSLLNYLDSDAVDEATDVEAPPPVQDIGMDYPEEDGATPTANESNVNPSMLSARQTVRSECISLSVGQMHTVISPAVSHVSAYKDASPVMVVQTENLYQASPDNNHGVVLSSSGQVHIPLDQYDSLFADFDYDASALPTTSSYENVPHHIDLMDPTKRVIPQSYSISCLYNDVVDVDVSPAEVNALPREASSSANTVACPSHSVMVDDSGFASCSSTNIPSSCLTAASQTSRSGPPRSADNYGSSFTTTGLSSAARSSSLDTFVQKNVPDDIRHRIMPDLRSSRVSCMNSSVSTQQTRVQVLSTVPPVERQSSSMGFEDSSDLNGMAVNISGIVPFGAVESIHSVPISSDSASAGVMKPSPARKLSFTLDGPSPLLREYYLKHPGEEIECGDFSGVSRMPTSGASAGLDGSKLTVGSAFATIADGSGTGVDVASASAQSGGSDNPGSSERHLVRWSKTGRPRYTGSAISDSCLTSRDAGFRLEGEEVPLGWGRQLTKLSPELLVSSTRMSKQQVNPTHRQALRRPISSASLQITSPYRTMNRSLATGVVHSSRASPSTPKSSSHRGNGSRLAGRTGHSYRPDSSSSNIRVTPNYDSNNIQHIVIGLSNDGALQRSRSSPAGFYSPRSGGAGRDSSGNSVDLASTPSTVCESADSLDSAPRLPSAYGDSLRQLTDLWSHHVHQLTALISQQRQQRQHLELTFQRAEQTLLDELQKQLDSLNVDSNLAVGTPDKTAPVTVTAERTKAGSTVQTTAAVVPTSSTASNAYQRYESRRTPPSIRHPSVNEAPYSFDHVPTPVARRHEAELQAASAVKCVVVPPEALQPAMHRRFCLLTAAARGYLTRRLLKTDKVQSIIYTAREAMRCALKLQQEVDMSHEVTQQDLQLYERLINQVYGACYSLHHLFISAPLAERLSIIAVDRQALRAASASDHQTVRDPPHLTRATLVALERKRVRESGGGSCSPRARSRSSAGSSRSKRILSSRAGINSSSGGSEKVASAVHGTKPTRRSLQLANIYAAVTSRRLKTGQPTKTVSQSAGVKLQTTAPSGQSGAGKYSNYNMTAGGGGLNCQSVISDIQKHRLRPQFRPWH